MFTFTVTRAPGDNINLPITVGFTVGGTATYPTDYTVSGATSFSATAGSILLAAGQMSASFTASPVPDSTIEANETIILTPQVQAGVFVIGSGSNWTATIIDDEVPASSVVLLINPIGANNSTIFVDSSSYAKTVTTVGDTKIINNKAVFDGNGDSLTIPSSTDFVMGGGDFTIECLFSTTQTNTLSTLISRVSSGFGAGSWAVQTTAAGARQLFWADFSNATPFLTASVGTSDGSSHHFAWERFGNTHTLYIDGTSAASTTSTLAMTDTATPLAIGTDLVYSNTDYAGNVGGVRITKGFARYQGNFTPPTNF